MSTNLKKLRESLYSDMNRLMPYHYPNEKPKNWNQLGIGSLQSISNRVFYMELSQTTRELFTIVIEEKFGKLPF